MGLTLQELASLVNGRVAGDPTLRVVGVSSLELAVEGQLSFVGEEKYWKMAEHSKASALVALHRSSVWSKPCIEVTQPSLAFAKIATQFLRGVPRDPPFVHPTAVIAKTSVIGPHVTVGPYAVIGEEVVIGDESYVGAHTVIEKDCRLGRAVYCHPHVTLLDRIVVGDRTIIGSGTVIGGDGFGYVKQSDGSHFKVPQMGRVRIEEDVEIGSNVSIDRATFGETVIGRGTKIDNLVHLAHNVVIGQNVILAGQVGIAGSAVIEDDAVLFGQVGVGDHVTIGARAVILSKSGLSHDVPEGAVMFGIPAKPHREMAKQLAEIGLLSKLRARVKELERRLASLEKE